jgi:hypothetical protein
MVIYGSSIITSHLYMTVTIVLVILTVLIKIMLSVMKYKSHVAYVL